MVFNKLLQDQYEIIKKEFSSSILSMSLPNGSTSNLCLFLTALIPTYEELDLHLNCFVLYHLVLVVQKTDLNYNSDDDGMIDVLIFLLAGSCNDGCVHLARWHMKGCAVIQGLLGKC
jgi:hypothetical protein